MNFEKMGSSLRVALDVCSLEPSSLHNSDCIMDHKHGFFSCLSPTLQQEPFETEIISILRYLIQKSAQCFLLLTEEAVFRTKDSS